MVGNPLAYARRGSIREPYDYVFVVCEGEKTEPIYLQGLKIAYRLSNANVRIIHPDAHRSNEYCAICRD